MPFDSIGMAICCVSTDNSYILCRHSKLTGIVKVYTFRFNSPSRERISFRNSRIFFFGNSCTILVSFFRSMKDIVQLIAYLVRITGIIQFKDQTAVCCNCTCFYVQSIILIIRKSGITFCHCVNNISSCSCFFLRIGQSIASIF